MEKTVKILLIEHDSDRKEYKYTIEQAGVSVELIEEFDIDKIKNAINNEYYDYVITDAFFLPKGQDHLSQTVEDEYRLPEIVKAIREIDSRLKIIVYTQFNTRIIYEHLNEVDYVFDKRYITSDLFKWQIERFKESELSNNYQEHAIISRLLELLNLDEDFIWKDELTQMLREYRNGINEIDQINAIRSSFIKIFQKCDFSKTGLELFEAIQLQEPLNIAGSPDKWGHLRHVINVFWLGYYIINSGLIDLNIFCKQCFPEAPNDSYNSLINEAWLIAAIFHDIGHLGENTNVLLNQINNSLSKYPNNSGKNQIELVCNGYVIDDLEFLKGIITAGDVQEIHNLIKANHNEKQPDHGVLSAMTVYDKLYDKKNEYKKWFLDSALRAMGLHNLFEKNFEKNEDILKDYSFDNFPLVNLLILCDHLEMWDRDTGFESISNKIPLEKIELSELKKEDDTLYLTINYRMHRALITNNVKVTEDALIALIDNHFFPLLNKMKRDSMPNINIKFLLNNRTELPPWPSIA